MRDVQPFLPTRGSFPRHQGVALDLAVDPGKYTGWALFRGHLIGCGVGEPPFDSNPCITDPISRLVIELPQVYPTHPVPPNDLITLSFLAGRLVGASGLTEVHTVSPHEWAGNVPKDVRHRRLRMWLSPDELKVLVECEKVVPKGQMHNVLDAVGIGIFAFRRAGV